MKVFVTGSTGFVGKHVMAELLARGFEVYAGARDIKKVGDIFGKRVTPVSTDFADKDAIRKALATVKPDAVIHLVGIISEIRAKGITFDSVHRQLAVDVYEAAKELGIKKAAHMSALGVHPDAPSYYHKSKLAAEQYLRASGLIYTIFRPSLIIGPEQKLFSDMQRFSGIAPIIPLPGGGMHRMQPVDVRDVAISFVAALEKDETDNRVYELCGPDVMSFRGMLEAIFSIWHRSVYYLNVPKRAMAFAGRVAETLMDNPPVSSDLIRMMWKDNICGLYGDAVTDGVRAVCGGDPVSFAESLKWALAVDEKKIR
jgi:uncharacterized protein YbjT (DUF2867 family)